MSYLALLSGMAEGAGGEFAKQGEEKRQAKVTNDRLLADSINKRLETDETLDWPSYSNLRSQEYKLRGLDPKSIQGMLQNEQPLWQRHQQLTQSGLKTNPQGGYTASDDPGEPGQAAALPAVPEAPVTTGSRRAEAAAQAQGIMDQQALAKQKGLNDLTYEQQKRQLDLVNGGSSAPTEHPFNGSVESEPAPRMRRKTGLSANGAITESQEPEHPQMVPGLVYGENVLKQFPNAQGIDPKGWYKKGLFSSSGEVVHYPGQPTTTQKIVYDPDSPTKASYVRQDPRGNIVGDPEVGAPSNLLPKATKRTTLQHVVNPATGQVEWHTVETDSTASPLIGGAVTPATPVPTKPVSQPSGTTTRITPPKGTIGLYGAPHGTVSDPGGTPPKIAGKTISPELDARINYLTGQVASGRMKIGDVKGDGTQFTQKQIQGAVQNNMADRGLDLNKVTGSQLDTANFAKSLENKLPHIYSEIDQLDKEGKLGVFASRYNEFMRGVGMENLSPQDKASYAQLAVDLGLVNTALMKIHTGSRGSTTIMTKFGDLINGGKMDAGTLKNSVHAAENWIHSYAQLVPTGSDALHGTGVGRGGGITPASPIPGATPKTADEYLKSIGQ